MYNAAHSFVILLPLCESGDILDCSCALIEWICVVDLINWHKNRLSHHHQHHKPTDQDAYRMHSSHDRQAWWHCSVIGLKHWRVIVNCSTKLKRELNLISELSAKKKTFHLIDNCKTSFHCFNAANAVTSGYQFFIQCELLSIDSNRSMCYKLNFSSVNESICWAAIWLIDWLLRVWLKIIVLHNCFWFFPNFLQFFCFAICVNRISFATSSAQLFLSHFIRYNYL
jgi:hypothetical protein